MKNKNALLAIILLGFFLRLALGVFSYEFLPNLPNGSEPQQAGYLFFDAFHRDAQAWELATSSSPLSTAFSGRQSSDQYGGLLWLLAFLYRYLTFGQHFVAGSILLSAFMGGVGIYYAYLSARRIFPASLGLVTAAMAAVYPESVLLGASQMREPFLIGFITMFLYGMLGLNEPDKRGAFLHLGFSTLGMLFISPGIVMVALVMLAGWVFFNTNRFSFQKMAPMILAGLGLFVLALVLLAASWEAIVAVKGGGLVGTLGNWARQTAVYNAYLLKQSSGIVQVMMESLPKSLAMPFIALYGVLQPVLPAVFFEPGEFFWKVLGIFRSTGWYATLPLLMFFPFALNPVPMNTTKKQWAWLFFVTVVWLIISSLRGGGDQWDNPRYRVILLPAILLLVTLAIANVRSSHPVILRKILVVEALNILIFCHWYSWRYAGFGFNLGIRNTILLSMLVSALILFGEMARPKPKRSTRV